VTEEIRTVDGIIVGVLCLLVAFLWARNHQHSTGQTEALNLAMLLSFTCLFVWCLANTLVFPLQAERAASRAARHAVADQWSPDEVVYTTRAFSGNGEKYFNLQFHLARRLQATPDYRDLAPRAPCLAIVTPSERQQLEVEGFGVEQLAVLNAHNGPPEVHVIRLRRNK
jgi:hypothetical protein